MADNKKSKETNTNPATSNENDSDGASASTSGDEQRESVTPTIYAVALPRDALMEYGLFLHYNRGAALEFIRSCKVGRCCAFKNLHDAVDYAGKPLEPKKKDEKKPKMAKGIKRRLKHIKSGYFPSDHFHVNLKTIGEDPQAREDKDTKLPSSFMEEDEIFEDFVENNPHMVGHEEDATEENAGSVDFEQNAEDEYLEEEEKSKRFCTR